MSVDWKRLLLVTTVMSASDLALAETPLTLFGVMDLAYESVQTGSGRISGLAPSGTGSSALGVRGGENLGGGLSAGFWLEGSLNPAHGIGAAGSSSHNQRNDTPVGAFILNRRATASLQSDYGELRLGRDYTPSGKNYSGTDPFNGNGVGAMLPSYTGSAAANTFLRASNAVSYFLPPLPGGLYGQAMAAFGNQPDNATQHGVDTSGNGRYAGAQLGLRRARYELALGYGQTRYAALTQTLGSTGLAGPGSSGGAPVAAGRFRDANLNASYVLNGVKLMALLARQTLDDVGRAGRQQSTRGWSLGLQVRRGRHHWLAGLSGVRLEGAKAQKLALGALYDLSKRSALYFNLARVRNSGGAAMSAGSYSANGLPVVQGPGNVNHGSTGFDMGMRLSF